MIADVNSPDPEFPLPSEQCLFCKKEGVKGGGIGFAICDLFRYELMQYKTVQYDEYSVCFRCGSVINYVVYIKRLLLTTLFSLPVEPPIFTRELPDISNDFNDNVRFILRCNIQDDRVSTVNGQISSARINGLKSPHLRIQEPYEEDDSRDTPLLEETYVTYEEPANIGYQRDDDDGRQTRRKNSRSQSVPVKLDSEPRTRSGRSKSQLSRPRSKAPKQHICQWKNCVLVYRSLRKLNKHNESMHRHVCSLCNSCSYVSREYLELHKKEKHDRICKLCEMPIKPKDVWYHRRHKHNFYCPYCSLQFHRNAHLKDHREMIHRNRKIIENDYKTNNDTNDSIIKTSDYWEDTEIIILSSNNIVTELDQAQSITVNNLENKRDTLSVNENSVESPTQQNDDELCRADSGIDSEQERSHFIDDTPALTSQIPQNNLEEHIKHRVVQISEIGNANLETNEPNEDRIEDFPVLVPPGPVASEISEPPALVASVSPVLQAEENRSLNRSASPVYANIRRSRRRRLNSIADDGPIILHLASSKSKDSQTSLSRENADNNLNIESMDQSNAPTEYVRRLRKRNAPPIVKPSFPNIMNTRSRSKVTPRYSNESEEDDHVETFEDHIETFERSVKKSKYDADVEVSITHAGSSIKEEHSQQIIKSKQERNETGVDDSRTLHNVKRRLLKRPDDSLEDIAKCRSVAITVDQNVKVIINKKVKDAVSKAKERDDVMSKTSPKKDSADTTLEDIANGTRDIEPTQKSTEDITNINATINVEPKRSSDTLNKDTIEETAKPLEDRICNTEPEQLNVSDKKDTVNNSDDFYKLGFYNELDNVKVSEKDEEVRNPATFDSCSNNIEQIVEIDRTNDTSDKTKTDVVCSISGNSLEDPESNDSATSWVIHEEEEDEGRPQSVSNQRIPDHVQEEKSSNHSVISNMDKIIEAVAIAQNVVSRSKSVKKSKSKNVKSNDSPLKSSKTRISASKSVRRAEIGHQTPTTKSTKLSPIQNVIPEAESAAKFAKISSAMNSVAKYMLSTLNTSSFETQSSDSPPYNDNSTILLYKKPSASANRLKTNIDNISTSNLNRMVNFSFTNSDHAGMSAPLSKLKTKTIRGNIRKERLHRRPTTFDDFILPGDSSSGLKTNAEDNLNSSDRILKQDVYTFPEIDTPSAGDQDTHVDVDTDTDKHLTNPKKKKKKREENAIKPPITLKKKRVISKPKRNTAFDNIIIEASQQYLKK